MSETLPKTREVSFEITLPPGRKGIIIRPLVTMAHPMTPQLIFVDVYAEKPLVITREDEPGQTASLV